MSEKIRVITVIISCVLLCSCATDVANRYYSSVRYTPRAPETVNLLRTRPTRDFIVLADFQSRGESPEDLRKKAAKIGADAIIITTLGGYASLNTEWANNDPHRNSYSRIVGTAIKYLDSRT